MGFGFRSHSRTHRCRALRYVVIALSGRVTPGARYFAQSPCVREHHRTGGGSTPLITPRHGPPSWLFGIYHPAGGRGFPSVSMTKDWSRMSRNMRDLVRGNVCHLRFLVTGRPAVGEVDHEWCRRARVKPKERQTRRELLSIGIRGLEGRCMIQRTIMSCFAYSGRCEYLILMSPRVVRNDIHLRFGLRLKCNQYNSSIKVKSRETYERIVHSFKSEDASTRSTDQL